MELKPSRIADACVELAVARPQRQRAVGVRGLRSGRGVGAAGSTSARAGGSRQSAAPAQRAGAGRPSAVPAPQPAPQQAGPAAPKACAALCAPAPHLEGQYVRACNTGRPKQQGVAAGQRAASAPSWWVMALIWRVRCKGRVGGDCQRGRCGGWERLNSSRATGHGMASDSPPTSLPHRGRPSPGQTPLHWRSAGQTAGCKRPRACRRAGRRAPRFAGGAGSGGKPLRMPRRSPSLHYTTCGSVAPPTNAATACTSPSHHRCHCPHAPRHLYCSSWTRRRLWCWRPPCLAPGSTPGTARPHRARC